MQPGLGFKFATPPPLPPFSRHPDILRVLFTEDQIQQRVRELGAQLTRVYAGRTIVLTGVLRGAASFHKDLKEAIGSGVIVIEDFLTVTSYHGGTLSQDLRLLALPQEPMTDRDVVYVEDIIDTGKTAHFLLDFCKANNPASVEIVALLDKNKAGTLAKYAGFHCPDQFVVGYGLDYEQRYRNLPYIGVLMPEIYK